MSRIMGGDLEVTCVYASNMSQEIMDLKNELIANVHADVNEL